jgi:hypothetical protein
MKFPVIFSSSARIISLLVLASLLQACSAAKLAYNQAPELAYWYLDGYVDFSSEQSLQVKDDLGKLQAWHRQTQLPSYIDMLQKLQQKIPADVDVLEACSIFSEVRRKVVVLTDQTQPAVVAILDTLSSSQLDAMARKFDKGNAEFRSDYPQLAKPTTQSKRYKRAVSRAETLYGRLDDKQLALVALQVEKSGFNATLAYAERQRRQQDTLQTLRTLLKNQATTEQKRQAVRSLFERALTSPNPSYAGYVDGLTQEGCKNFADLHNSTTASQRRKAVTTLAAYEQDMKTLSARGNG